MSVTIKDVAKKANVSISTVSRVINNSKPVSDDIKKRVLDVIRDTGYSPNPVARSLVMKKSRTIGIIVPDISSSYIGEVLNAIEEIAKTYSYETILCNSYAEKDQEIKYLNLLVAKQVEGIIFITFDITNDHKEFINSQKIPVVMVNRNISDTVGTHSVGVDHYKAAYEMTKYLIKQGHRKIGLIRNGKQNGVFGAEHLRAYKQAIEEDGIEYDENLIFEGKFQSDRSYDIVESLIKEDKLPTAIFATSDDMAIGAMNALYDNGYKIPKDVSVVGFYDTKMSKLFRPKLTTIRQPIYDMGAVSLRLLIKLIKGEKLDKKTIILPHELIIRDSCRYLELDER